MSAHRLIAHHIPTLGQQWLKEVNTAKRYLLPDYLGAKQGVSREYFETTPKVIYLVRGCLQPLPALHVFYVIE
jgi:hypothetical protein